MKAALAAVVAASRQLLVVEVEEGLELEAVAVAVVAAVAGPWADAGAVPGAGPGAEAGVLVVLLLCPGPCYVPTVSPCASSGLDPGHQYTGSTGLDQGSPVPRSRSCHKRPHVCSWPAWE